MGKIKTLTDEQKEIERKFFSSVENPKPATEELKDVYRTYGKYVRVDVSAALEAQAAELAEVRQQYVDANEARIDAEASLEAANKRADEAEALVRMLEDAETVEIMQTLRARVAIMQEALEIIAGKRQCLDNLMGNKDVALAALKGASNEQG